MKYLGTSIYTDGSKHRRGAACYAAIILCDDRFICEITNAIRDTTVTAGQMEIEAIYQTVTWIIEHPGKTRPPYRLFTDYEPFVRLYNGSSGSNRDDAVTRTIRAGKDLEVEVIHIPAHSQGHNGNKACDITCRALSGVVLQNESYFPRKGCIADANKQQTLRGGEVPAAANR